MPCLCGNPMDGRRPQAKYCSGTCRIKGFRIRAMAKRVGRSCESCKKGIGTRPNKKYCSRKCMIRESRYRKWLREFNSPFKVVETTGLGSPG